MEKNQGGKWVVFAFEDEGGSNPGEPVTGDAANITANVRIDGGAANAVDDTNPTELEDGYYIFDITAAESNGDLLLICPASGTANVNVIGVPGTIRTTPANFNDLSITTTTGRVDVGTVTGDAPVTAEDVRTEMDSNSTQLAAIVADTGTDGVVLADGAITNAKLAGNLEIVFETDFATNYNQTRNAWVTNAQDFVGTTASDPFNGQVVAASVSGAVASVTAAVTVDTISDGAIGADAVADIFSTTTIAEAYPADGAAGTPAEIMYLVMQSLHEFAISSTTRTVKKLDGTTTAATFTLDDDTTPTSTTRAT